MSYTIDILNWDSVFFDRKVCRINGVPAGTGDWKVILQELKQRDIDLAYYSSPLPLPHLSHLPKLYDIYLVDRKMTYAKETDKNAPVSTMVSEFKEEYPTGKLIDLAIQSGIYSRFNVDKKIGDDKFRQLYKEWIINSVNKKIAMEVLVYRENDTIMGVITLGDKNSTADIGIIAVDNNHRGKGIGKTLLLSAENRLATNYFRHVQVVTQADNVPACRLYESCGYKIEKSEYFYHLWKKDYG